MTLCLEPFAGRDDAFLANIIAKISFQARFPISAVMHVINLAVRRVDFYDTVKTSDELSLMSVCSFSREHIL